MRVLYVSKAMVASAYRDKLHALAALVELQAVVPERWDSRGVEPASDAEPWLRTARTRGRSHNHFHTYVGARRLIALAAADLVHIDEEPYSAVTAQLARHCRRRGIPFVFFAWQNLPKRIPAPFRALRRYVFTHAAGGIAGTAAAADVLRGWGYEGPLAVIPQMGVDAGRFHPDAAARRQARLHIGAMDGDFVVGFGGRIVREKGVHVLAHAVAGLDCGRLLVLGAGPERAALEREAARAGIAERIHFAGPVPSSQMPLWLPACDVLVLPSLTTRTWAEQFGRVLIEAMACGVPVIGSDSGEIPGVIGDAGIVVPEGDAVALRSALVRLSSSPAERALLSERGRRRVLQHYTNAGIADRTVAFYREIVRAGVAAT